MKPTTRILIADDHSLVRMGLRMLIATAKDLEIVGEAENGEAAVQLAKARNPDIVIMDLVMPVLNGTDATNAIRKSLPNTQVLLLTTFAAPEEISAALNSGAAGALLKSSANAELLKAIRLIASGKTFISNEIRELLSDIPSSPSLTERQQQVLASVTRGLSNREISIQLGISQERIKQHLNAIYEKIGAANRAEAVAIALRKHLLNI